MTNLYSTKCTTNLWVHKGTMRNRSVGMLTANEYVMLLEDYPNCWNEMVLIVCYSGKIGYVPSSHIWQA